MKETGIVRNLDDLGRVVIPRKVLRSLGIEPNTSLLFVVDGNTIRLEKWPDPKVGTEEA